MKLTLIAGARPNFMKIAPIIDVIRKSKSDYPHLEYRLVHTGQHYDKNMSQSFFDELDIPAPDVNLESGGGSQAEQTANIMVRFEKELASNPADLVIVVGDVTSTLACSITAKKLGTKVAHVEGGIRSGDMSMPEEINRIVTDSITDYFFTTSEVANQNLRLSGVSEDRIFFVGNTMIDSLQKNMSKLIQPEIWNELGLKKGSYFILTLHRPSNVDDKEHLKNLITGITNSAASFPVLFPVHPRTAKKIKELDINGLNLHLLEPLSYLRFNYLVKHAQAVITDSGGITEETTVMHVPCITLRTSTERPETITQGTNELAGNDPEKLKTLMNKIINGKWKKGKIPEKWDGKAAERIIEIIATKLLLNT